MPQGTSDGQQVNIPALPCILYSDAVLESRGIIGFPYLVARQGSRTKKLPRKAVKLCVRNPYRKSDTGGLAQVC